MVLPKLDTGVSAIVPPVLSYRQAKKYYKLRTRNYIIITT